MGPTDAALIPLVFFFFFFLSNSGPHSAPRPLVWALSGRSQTRIHPPRPKTQRALAQEPEAATPAVEERGPISSEVRLNDRSDFRKRGMTPLEGSFCKSLQEIQVEICLPVKLSVNMKREY